MNLSLSNTSFWLSLAMWAFFVISMGWIAARFVLRRPRHRTVLLLSVFACSLLPFFAHLLPAAKPIGFTFHQTPYSTTYIQTPVQIAVTPSGQSIATQHVAATIETRSMDWEQIFVVVWLAGAGIGLLLLVRAIIAMNRLARLGEVDSPVVAGFPVARMVLPTAWPCDLTPEEVEAALAHERAHIRGLHVAGRVAVECFRCFFWWIPAVHLASRFYEFGLEEIADAEALRTVEPRSLGNALVKIASFAHRPGLGAGATSNGRHLEERLKKIMERKPVGRWPFATLVVVGSVLAGIAATPRFASAPSFESGEATFGLGSGAQWTYELEHEKPDLKTHPARQVPERYTLSVNKIIDEKDMKVFELISKYESGAAYSYRGLSKRGLYGLPITSLGGPGYTLSDAEPVLLNSAKKGSTWTWFEPFRGQVMMDANGQAPDTSKYDNDCLSRVESIENVTVKAGTFRCYRVGTSRTSQAVGRVTSTAWISPEVGVVKLQTNSEYPATWELQSYISGK
ncbi:MAG: hypothetical protein GC165_03510 [Armatimonadetes bacterium]|nr:hypothetical protein [Armatimonadota bacterium]